MDGFVISFLRMQLDSKQNKDCREIKTMINACDMLTYKQNKNLENMPRAKAKSAKRKTREVKHCEGLWSDGE